MTLRARLRTSVPMMRTEARGVDTALCEHCGGPLWVPPHPQAGYQASMICDCKEVGRRNVKWRIAVAKLAGRWA